MPLQLTVHHGLPYLLLEIKGTAHLADGLGVMAFAAAACGAATYQRCLLDFRETQVSWTFTEHLQWGASAGETLRNLEKVASVVPPS